MKKRILFMALAITMVLSVFVGCSKSENEDDASKTTTSEKEETRYNEKFEDVEGWNKDRFTERDKIKYAAAKFVYEDMTQKFKHKEEFIPSRGIHIWASEKTLYGELESLVCDIANIIPEDSHKYKWDRETYKEFAGFDKNAVKVEMDEETIYVNLYANYIEYQGERKSPLWVSVSVIQNDDGTFSYKGATITYELYDYLLD